ncbi:lipase [Rhodococcus hoagii]|nr:lipase [Prescottella equi]MBM4654118.1 lipase [Prescottella equi]MBM4719593.1 lipase [Prescottella equi]NKR23391.1 lipase [Prescottella equi]NKT55998.1 lipase [Prescottella equi]
MSHISPSRVRWVGAALSVSVAVLLSPVPAHAVPVVYPTALSDEFYSEPTNLQDLQPGDVISARDVPAPAGFVDTSAMQLAFRSTNSQGNPIVAVTTVLSPTTGAIGRPLFSFQHIVNALGLECAPSQALYTSNPNLVIREAPGLNVVLQKGWSVAIPDHLGPTSAYGAARLGGQITLDGIRAAKNQAALGLADSPVGMAGYSGGGMATAMAAALAPSYAPEINLVGSAYGGAPLNIGKMAHALGSEPHPAFGLAMAAALGLEREYPDQMPVTGQLNESGRALRDRLANACTNDILAAGAGHSVAAVSTSAALLDSPQVQAVFAANSVESIDTVPNAPVFEWHAEQDALIPVESITSTMRRYCDAGVPVQSKSVWSPDHLSAAVVGLPNAVQFLEDRFSGIAPTHSC